VSAVVYIIPGFRESANSKAYRAVANGFQKQKIKPVMITIRWKYRSMTDYLHEFNQQVKNTTDELYLVGFSFGAMIAAIAAPNLKPKKLFLCSLSPFFKEDLPALSIAARRSLGAKRLLDFSKYPFSDIAKNIKSSTFLFRGENELPSVIERSEIAQKKIRNSKLIIVKGANHDLRHPNYMHEILKCIQLLT
jgi:alpha/beta superfamily hydrolase